MKRGDSGITTPDYLVTLRSLKGHRESYVQENTWVAGTVTMTVPDYTDSVENRVQPHLGSHYLEVV